MNLFVFVAVSEANSTMGALDAQEDEIAGSRTNTLHMLGSKCLAQDYLPLRIL